MAEQSLQGGTDKITPSEHLSINQRNIFESIVLELKESNILSNLDVHILNIISIAIDRLQTIDNMINQNMDLYKDKELMKLRKECINDIDKFGIHLCLSPQSRAKLSLININHKAEQHDPLLKVLNLNG